MIRILNDLNSLSKVAAEIYIEKATQAVRAHGRFVVALAGGNTPRTLYRLLAAAPYRDQILWKFVHVFWGDERCVPPADPRSNARMAHQVLFDHIPLPAENIHTIQGSLPPAQAASRYEAILREFFGNQPPVFDLILLGMGENAHTASLFPHTAVLSEKERWVAEVYVAEQDMYRITFTVPLINQADQVVFLVSGAEKAPALQKVLEGSYHPVEYPAQLIHPKSDRLIWLVDKAASSQLITNVDKIF